MSNRSKFTVHFETGTLDKLRDVVYAMQTDPARFEGESSEGRTISSFINGAIVKRIEDLESRVGPIETRPLGTEVHQGRPKKVVT